MSLLLIFWKIASESTFNELDQIVAGVTGRIVDVVDLTVSNNFDLLVNEVWFEMGGDLTIHIVETAQTLLLSFDQHDSRTT